MNAALRLVNGRNLWVVPLIAGVLLALAPWLGAAPTDLRQLTLIALLTMSVSGLNLTWGFGGELAVGQIVNYCIGAYVGGWFAINGYDMALGVLASVVASALLGFVVALPSVRVGGWGLAMASFFLVFLIPIAVNSASEQTGGLSGLTGIPAPVLFGNELSVNAYFVLVIVCAMVWLALMRNFVTSRHGDALKVIRESAVLSSALGLSVRRLKTTAYVLGAVPAGLAGSLFVFLDGFVAPEYFNFGAAILIIAASVLGGLETVYGAAIGAAVLTYAGSEIGAFDRYADLVFGAFLIAGGILLTNPTIKTGLEKAKRRVRRWRVATAADDVHADRQVPTLAGPTINVIDVAKSFGGTQALRGVTLEAKPGEITALIGANGSGKTTLLNIISGFYKPSEGTLLLNREPLPAGRPAATARCGLARSFQTPLMPRTTSTLQAVAIARYTEDRLGILSAMLRLPRYWQVRGRDHDSAGAWLAAVGLIGHDEEMASSLPLGSRRLLEVARALATGSAALLLDEPASGLDPADVDAFAALLHRLRDAGATIILVEHNFGLVCDIADTIYVLDQGWLIAKGTADEIRSDNAVARSYLGQEFTTEPASDLELAARQDLAHE
jgi:branched-chain amino acid transport system permease protein